MIQGNIIEVYTTGYGFISTGKGYKIFFRAKQLTDGNFDEILENFKTKNTPFFSKNEKKEIQRNGKLREVEVGHYNCDIPCEIGEIEFYHIQVPVYDENRQPTGKTRQIKRTRVVDGSHITIK